MKPLTSKQAARPAELLEMIVRPGIEREDDSRMFAALEEAAKLFGYWKPTPHIAKRE